MSNENIKTLRHYLELAKKDGVVEFTAPMCEELGAAIDGLEDTLKKKPAAKTGPQRYALEVLKDDEDLRGKLQASRCFIWSRKHEGYYGRSMIGIVNERKVAGLYTFPAAWEATEKLPADLGIEFELVGGGK